MEAFIGIMLCIIAVFALCVRSAFIFPDKAHKPVFWIVSAIVTIVLGVVGFVIIKVLDL